MSEIAISPWSPNQSVGILHGVKKAYQNPTWEEVSSKKEASFSGAEEGQEEKESLQGPGHAEVEPTSQAYRQVASGVLRANTRRHADRQDLRLSQYKHGLLLQLEGQGRDLPQPITRQEGASPSRGRGLCSVRPSCSPSKGSLATWYTTSKLRRQEQSDVDTRHDNDGKARPSKLGKKRIYRGRYFGTTSRRQLPLNKPTTLVYLNMQEGLHVAITRGV